MYLVLPKAELKLVVPSTLTTTHVFTMSYTYQILEKILDYINIVVQQKLQFSEGNILLNIELHTWY